MEKTPEQKIIDTDIYRYKKNKLAANLALLGLVCNCLYFTLLYGIKTATSGADNAATRFASMTVGFSVILTLAVLLVAFLSSEGIKGYNKKYSIVLLVLAAFQVFRIFGYPMYGLKNDLLKVNYFWFNPESSGLEFTLMLIYLLASAACFIASAVIGYIRAVQLEKFEKYIAEGKVSIEDTLKKMDEQDSAANVEVK